MGYTHYYTFKNSHGNTDNVEKLYQNAIKDCNLVIAQYYNEFKGTDLSLSGYSAHCNGKYGGIDFNGKGDLSHENFLIREHFNQNEGFNFCKTAQKPYDLIVVACLSILKYHLGNYIQVESDGDFLDWIEGTTFAQLVLNNVKILNPLFIEIKAVN